MWYPEGGNSIDTHRRNNSLRCILPQVGLPVSSKNGFIVHSLRRILESQTINSGVPKPFVDRYLGHGTRRDVYTVCYELSDEESRKWMNRVPFHRPETEDKS